MQLLELLVFPHVLYNLLFDLTAPIYASMSVPECYFNVFYLLFLCKYPPVSREWQCDGSRKAESAEESEAAESSNVSDIILFVHY